MYQAVRAAGNPVRLGVMVPEDHFKKAADLDLRVALEMIAEWILTTTSASGRS
jgi:hypothetical protein